MNKQPIDGETKISKLHISSGRSENGGCGNLELLSPVELIREGRRSIRRSEKLIKESQSFLRQVNNHAKF